MKVKLVEQEDRFGCTIACIAMVLNKSYQDVKKDFGQSFDGDEDGLSNAQITEYVSDFSTQILMKQVEYYSHIDFGRNFILEPFAPVHILQIRPKFDSNHHAVVMDEKGNILCPDGKTDKETRDSYKFIASIGIWMTDNK